MAITESTDHAAMRAAIALARVGLGTTAPNPSVGCVIRDRDGRTVARARTGRGGRPHAEAAALAQAGTRACEGTAYVTLEPCAHEGETPSCARLLEESGLKRVVYGAEDPDPRTRGRGALHLREKGVKVEGGCLVDEAKELMEGHAFRLGRRRPRVSLKVGTTLDGRIATAAGESRWVTGPEARRHVHLVRAEHDAILVGAATAAADDPLLTVRLPGLEGDSPVPVVLDGSPGLDPRRRLVTRAAGSPVWMVVASSGSPSRIEDLVRAGVRVISVDSDPEGHPDSGQALAALAEGGITSLLIEGGGRVAASYLRKGHVDRLYWYRAPTVLGSDGIPAVGVLGHTRLVECTRFRHRETRRLGPDTLDILVRGEGNPASAG